MREREKWHEQKVGSQKCEGRGEEESGIEAGEEKAIMLW